MKLDVTTLRRLSPLLDEALDLEASKRELWLSDLQGVDADLTPILRELLAKEALVETNDLLEKGPQFTASGAAVHPSEHAAGDILGAYRLIKEVARGGMGEVWLAERADGSLKRSVALKLPILAMRRSVLVQRFERERDILAALVHPNIARLYDAGFAADGQPYLAMEYVEGLPITQYCEQRKLDRSSRIQLLLQVMDAVQFAHANLVIHRDLKPSNVLVTEEGKALLLDFGIAKLLSDQQLEVAETALTQLGGRALTLEYAAPEQITGAPVSTSTDVYALGVILYEMLGHQRPFQGSKREIELAILTQVPALPARLPTDLATVVLKALKKAPSERYVSVSAFAADLERWLQGEPVMAQPDSASYRIRKFVGRHRVSVATGILVSAALVAASVVSVSQAMMAKRESQTAAAVESFLQGIFSANSSAQPDPERARRTSARDLLDIGARRITTELQDAPQAKLRVLATLAKMYDDLTLSEPALLLYRQQVTLLRQIEPGNSVKLALALAEVGSRSAQANAMEESKKAFDEASAIFVARNDSASFDRGVLELKIASVMQDQRDPKALGQAKRAVEILKGFPPTPELLSAMEYQAFVASDFGDLPASLRLLNDAIRIAPEVQNVTAHQLVGLHLELARLLNQDYQINAAESSMRRAYDLALAKEGADSHLTLNAALELGNQFYNNGEYVKALATFEPAAMAAERALAKGDRTWLPLLLVAYQGGAKMKMGEVDAGLQLLKRVQQARDILDANPPIDTFLRFFVAEAHAMRGERVAVDAELDAARKVMNATKMDEIEREAGELTFATLRCALIRADSQTARRMISQGHLGLVKPDEVPNATLRRLVRLAEAQLVARDLPAALASATAMLSTLPKSTAPSYDGDRERRDSLVAGKVHFLQGRADLALPLLRRAVALAEGRLSTRSSPQHADALVWLGQVLVSMGHMDEAREFKRAAQQIFERHGRLEEAFRSPLIALTARLNAGKTAL